MLVVNFYSPHHCQLATKKVLGNVVCRVKRGSCPAFKWYNLLITGFTFVGFIDIKRIDLSTVWLLVDVIVPTVFVLYVFFTASLRGESIVVTNLHWVVKKTIRVILFYVKSLWFRRCIC